MATGNQEKAVAEISIKDFMDFLKMSYQVNEAIDKPSLDVPEKSTVDWNRLTANELISRLKERESVFLSDKAGKKNAGSSVPAHLKTTKSENAESYAENLPVERKPSCENAANAMTRQTSTVSLDRKVVFDKGKRCSPNRKKGPNNNNGGPGDTDGAEDKAPARVLKKKLSEILHEGILDSILPYLLPKQQVLPETSHAAQKKSQNPNDVRKPSIGSTERLSSVASKDKIDSRKKSTSSNEGETSLDKKDIEVVIHVCDEIKNLKRDFKCSQRLLISEMGYFAEVTNGQKLEDMDISVHCDVTIFDWLMRWVQKDKNSQKHWPTLDSSIVIPVLMSSAFLQMVSLQDYCLQYCQSHINDIIRDSPNLSCINDNVLTRLASLFSNVDIESIVDKKDKIQSKLFCKLIVALNEPEPQVQKGHYSSIATMYRCSKCLKLILKNMSGSVSCVPSNMIMTRNGSTHSSHFYDSTWNLTDYVRDLKATWKTWRKVYWRLWADCHFLYCTACEEYFPVYQMSWCRHHTEPVQYFHLENEKSIFHPVGRYTCCGERAYRFEVIKKISGCCYRDHVLNSKSPADTEILKIWSHLKNIISCDPPQIVSNVKFVKATGPDGKISVRDGFWWDGLKLVPAKQTPGLLNKVWEECKIVAHPVESRNVKGTGGRTGGNMASNNAQDISSFSDSSDDSCSSSNAGNSEESCHSMTKITSKSKSSGFVASNRLSLIRKEKKKRRKKKKQGRNDENRFWLPRLSTRSNQDNQRDFEERALRQIELVLAKKLSGESFRGAGTRSYHQIIPPGGIYVKLEQEWREAHCFSHGCPGSSIKAKGSSSYINVHNNSFTVQRRSKSKGHR